MPRILIVDDSRVMQRLVANLLADAGAELAFASAGDEAAKAHAALPADLVVSDIQMPGLTGIELAEHLHRGADRPRIVLMSAGDAEGGRDAVQRGVADAFLPKPLDGGALRRLVAELAPWAFDGEVPSRPRKLRVLIADDTEIGRRLLERTLSADPDIEIVAIAHDGPSAVEAAERHRPKLVVLDAFMPGMDGIATTREIMRRAPAPVVLLTPAMASEASSVAFEATRAGAVDFLVPPSWGDVASPASQAFRARLKELAEVPVVSRRTAGDRAPGSLGRRPLRLITVCSSTGGPAALATLLRDGRAAVETTPFVVVQHMLAGFGATFAEWLASTSGVDVRFAGEGAPLAAGVVWLAPEDRHVVVRSPTTLGLDDGPPRGVHRPSGTVLFESAAEVFGNDLGAVLLTGMGEDGVAGLARVRAAGGVALVQSPSSCVVPGMPEAAIRAGHADVVLPPVELAAALVEALQRRDRT